MVYFNISTYTPLCVFLSYVAIWILQLKTINIFLFNQDYVTFFLKLLHDMQKTSNIPRKWGIGYMWVIAFIFTRPIIRIGRVYELKWTMSVPHHSNFSTLWCFRLYKPYIFWKLLVQGYLNWYSQVSHTQIHKFTKCLKDPTCGMFLKRISKIIFPCVKRTNTKIQI